MLGIGLIGLTVLPHVCPWLIETHTIRRTVRMRHCIGDQRSENYAATMVMKIMTYELDPTPWLNNWDRIGRQPEKRKCFIHCQLENHFNFISRKGEAEKEKPVESVVFSIFKMNRGQPSTLLVRSILSDKNSGFIPITFQRLCLSTKLSFLNCLEQVPQDRVMNTLCNCIRATIPSRPAGQRPARA